MVGLKCHILFDQGQIPSYLPDTMFNFTPHHHDTFERATSVIFHKEQNSVGMWLKDIAVIHCQLTYYKLHNGKVNVCLSGKGPYATGFVIGIIASHMFWHLLLGLLIRLYLSPAQCFCSWRKSRINKHMLSKYLRQSPKIPSKIVSESCARVVDAKRAAASTKGRNTQIENDKDRSLHWAG